MNNFEIEHEVGLIKKQASRILENMGSASSILNLCNDYLIDGHHDFREILSEIISEASAGCDEFADIIDGARSLINATKGVE
jgi:hypothetical protein